MSQAQSRTVTKERPPTAGGKDFFLGRRPANRRAEKQANVLHTDSAIQRMGSHEHGSARRSANADPVSTLSRGQLELVQKYRREAFEEQSHIKRHFEAPDDSQLGASVEAVRPTVVCGPNFARAHVHTAPNNQSLSFSACRTTSRPSGRVREITADSSLYPLGSGRRSEEPYRDTLRPMRNAKALMESMQAARRGGVFRTMPSKGSLMVRNHYRHKPASGEMQEAVNDSAHNGALSLPADNIDQEHPFVLLDETDANLWYVCATIGCACAHLMMMARSLGPHSNVALAHTLTPPCLCAWQDIQGLEHRNADQRRGLP